MSRQFPRYEDVEGVGMTFSRLTLIVMFFFIIGLIIWLIVRRRLGGPTGGMTSLLKEAERLQKLDKLFDNVPTGSRGWTANRQAMDEGGRCIPDQCMAPRDPDGVGGGKRGIGSSGFGGGMSIAEKIQASRQGGGHGIVGGVGGGSGARGGTLQGMSVAEKILAARDERNRAGQDARPATIPERDLTE